MNLYLKKYRSRVGRGLMALWVVGGLSGVASSAMAQGTAASETTIPGGTLVMITYVALWLIFGGVLFGAIWRQRKLQRDLDQLEGRIDRLLGTDADQ